MVQAPRLPKCNQVGRIAIGWQPRRPHHNLGDLNVHVRGGSLFGEVVLMYVVVCKWVTFFVVPQMVVFLNVRSCSIGGGSEGVFPIVVYAFWS